MALGAILAYMSAEAVERVIQMLLTLIKHEDWQARHGGVLGLKHYMAMSKVVVTVKCLCLMSRAVARQN